MTRSPAAATGSALVLALVVLFVITTLALAAGMGLRTHWKQVDRHTAVTRARDRAANAACVAAAMVTADTNGWDALDEPWAESALPRSRAWTDVAGWIQPSLQRVDILDRRLALTDEERALNINTASPDAIAWVLQRAARLTPRQAAELTAAILDWRDADDDETASGGAEDAWYARQDPPVTCANAPLEDLRELRLLRGMDDRIFAAAVPFLTVYGDGRINVNTASPEVIEAILRTVGSPDAAGSLMARVVRFRARGGIFRSLQPNVLARTMTGSMRLERNELDALATAIPKIAIESRHFRGYACAAATAAASHPVVRIEFVVDRASGDFVRWVEL